ncbi:MAG: DnaJ domain-containing protein [Myxococcaceae bacterium]|nr:DnaJ domain-containing protein [Myxococcaceae bacterium]
MSTTLPVSDDPFEVLGVATDVTDKDLKKRYYALLRQYPPETHPDEFNRVQRAFDELKDPAARAAYLENKKEPYENVEEPYRTRLRDALAQLHAGEVELARAALKTLIVENGDLDDARNLLHQIFFNEEAWAEAEKQLQKLRAKHPENTWYLYRHALVLSKLERHAEAGEASDAWLKVSAGRDVLAWEFIAESLAAQNRHDEAYRRLEEGIAKVQHPAPLILTRMHLRLETLDKKGLEHDLAALKQSLAPNDDENRQGAAQRLQSLAALFFSRALPDEANALLKVARELGGKEQGVQFPQRLEVFIEELPEASRQWLVDETKEQHIFKQNRRGKAVDVFIALLLTALWGLVALVSVVNESGWPGGLAIAYWLVALGATAPMVWSWRELTWSFAVPYRRMVSVHPLYMLEVGVEKLVAWPLVNFNEPRIVHQYTNGIYTQSNVTLQFGKKKVAVGIKGQQLAVDFAQALQNFRYRALQLMHSGMLEAEQGFDFIPLEFLAPGHRSKVKVQKRAARAKRWGWSAGVAAVLAVAAAVVGANREREKVWANAVNTGSATEMAKVLQQRPHDGSSEAFEAYRHAKMVEARRGLEATLEKTDPRLLALNALLGEIERSPHPVVHLRTSTLPAEGVTGPQATAFSDRELQASLRRIPLTLYNGFSQALTARARDVLAVSPNSVERGVAIDVALTPRLLPRQVRVGKTRWPVVGLSAKATLKGQELADVTVELDDGDFALLSSPNDARAVLDAQLTLLLEKAGAALAKACGLAVEP